MPFASKATIGLNLGQHQKPRLTNLRHSLTTRFLVNCISSQLFDKKLTLNNLHDAFADDAAKLFYEGIDVASLQT